MYAISKEFAFSAAHHLEGLDEGHPCMRAHGHNYLVRVTINRLELDRCGFVMDYGDLGPFACWIDDMLDHRDLNDYLPQPTAENLARALHDTLHETVSVPDGCRVQVAVSETPKTWAIWTD